MFKLYNLIILILYCRLALINFIVLVTLLLESDDLKRVFSHAEIAFANAIASRITTNLQHYLVEKANKAKY